MTARLNLYVSRPMMAKTQFANEVMTIDSAKEALGMLEGSEVGETNPLILFCLI